MVTRPQEPLLPWLLRRTTRLFLARVRDALAAAGFADLSQRAMWAVHGLAGRAATASELVDVLQVTKQAVSTLVEELVVSDYVRRDPDPIDRRRTLLVLTPRGEQAARVIETACADVEAQFVSLVGSRAMRGLRGTLSRLLAAIDPDGAP